MKKVIDTLLDKLAKQAGEVATGEVALAKEKEESAQFYKWWQDEVAITKQLKADVADLEVKLTLTPAERIVADAKEEIDEILKNEDS